MVEYITVTKGDFIMRTCDLVILRKSLSKEISMSFIKEEDDKIRSFTNFMNIINDKCIFTEEQLELFAAKYRDSIYGQTFLDMICVLNASDVKISDVEYENLYRKYMKSRTSDEEEYRNMIEDVKTIYGDCDGFFSEEYIESKINKEKEIHFSSSVKDLFERGYTIDNIKILLEKNGIEEFNLDTKIYVNNKR